MTGFILPRPERRSRGIAILPLINVIFLLLIFIILSGVIASPDPFQLTPPEARVGEEFAEAGPGATIYVSTHGNLLFRDVSDEAAVIDLVTKLVSSGDVEVLTVRADAGVPATRIVKLVEELRSTGIAGVQLQAERKP
jgi:biopolymer transport protein ExbD